MDIWRKQLEVDAIPSLLAAKSEAIRYFARRDLLGEAVSPVGRLWALPEAERILRRQKADGSWKYPGGKEHVRSREDYNQLETFRLGQLNEMYGLDRSHGAVIAAAEFLLAHQTGEGDIRDIFRMQYVPHYTAGMLELLVKAGYAGEARIEKGFRWLLSIRQDDGGWAFPLRAAGVGYAEAVRRPDPIPPDRSKPFSHLLTGVVLRAFAAHPRRRKSQAAHEAGRLLMFRFFQPDKYIDRRDRSYWGKVSFPFWFTDIVSAPDSLSLLGFAPEDPGIKSALEWMRGRQGRNGHFRLELLKASDPELPLWMALAVCRIFKRFYV
ncbi:MAG: hypothetical protein ABSF61_09925 [Anaerolineales bacterium]|jgi:hypothetical protein